jgi:opacity protein-like surface antigen
MRKFMQGGLFLALALALAAVPAQAQIKLEITGFGGFGFNMAFASTVKTDAGFASDTASFYDAWQPFFNDPVLEMKAGPGFGGRIALWFTPMIGFEGSFEYSMQKPRFNQAVVADLEGQMDDINYNQYFSMVAEGGKMIRFYGNIIFDLMPGARFSPYLTAGLGMTTFTIEPNISIERSAYGESMSLTYDSPSALTINAGGGFKAWFTPMIGLRVDARIFYAPSAKFAQTYAYKIFGTNMFPADNYVTQSGAAVDAVITVGLVIRLGN